MNFLDAEKISSIILVIANGIALSILFLCIVYVWSWKQRQKIQKELREAERTRDISHINKKMDILVEGLGFGAQQKIHERHSFKKKDEINMEKALEQMFEPFEEDEKELQAVDKNKIKERENNKENLEIDKQKLRENLKF